MKNIVIVDIDGTLTKVGDRAYCLKQDIPDWDSFYNRCGEDEPVTEIIEMVEHLSRNYQIILMSGRRESCREATTEWFCKNSGINAKMYLRKDGDHRHDTIVKPEMLKVYNIDIYDIAFVLEDRNSMVKKWREMGLVCLQVTEGDF